MAAALAVALIAGCSGGTDSQDPAAAEASLQEQARTGGGGKTKPGTPTLPVTAAEASRFLAQASFGATAASIEAVRSAGYGGWLDREFARAQTLHLPVVDERIAALLEGQTPSMNFVYNSFWRNAATAEDALRQRVAFALSEIFVISTIDSNVARYPRGVASYLDMLGRNSFGNFRTLMEEVTRHPMMGLYLSHLRNQKGDPAVGRSPDENYAREFMQLFTIGLYRLNSDGTVRVDRRGNPVPAYTEADVSGLARVFTGFSWAGPDTTSNRFLGRVFAPDHEVLPMQGYAQYHEPGAKSFLGVTIDASTPDASLTAALDHIFSNTNIGPFISKQLIQRLVTSNPSAAYVSRVSKVFNNNGAGVRGDMKAVIKAILLDVEARDATIASQAGFGKVREPILRQAAWMRAFDTRSNSGWFLVNATDDSATSLGQTPMRSPSVFNFFRPGFVPSGTSIAAAGLVAPEMQIVDETSVAGYPNYVRSFLSSGLGTSIDGIRDVQADYTDEIALADNPAALIDRVALLLNGGQASSALRSVAKVFS
jgi:uncharacterized protein (DUF1800 family)